MAILKSEIKNKYSTIPNEIIRDKTLSHSEYRLLIYLYSLPDNWKINQGYLASELNTTRNKINQRLSNIKKLGFLDIKKNTNLEEIDVDYLYILKVPVVSNLGVSNLGVSNLGVSKTGTHINNDITNTDITNTNIINNLNTLSSITPTKKSYGNFKRVKLTDEELKKLINDFGEEFIKEKINQLDEYLEINNNKNKYKNFNLVLRKAIKERWFESKKEKLPIWIEKENSMKEITENEIEEMKKQIEEMVAENFQQTIQDSFQQTIQDSFQNKLNKQMQNFTETMKGKLR